MARPRKIKLPCGLDDWLRLALHGKRLEDRWKIFREWRRWYLIATLKREPTEDELESEIKKWREFEFYLSNQDGVWMENLRHDFLPIFQKQNRVNRAKAMAAGRWRKKERKSS